MIYSVDFIDLAGKISHVDVSKYLHDLGWDKIASKRNNVQIFQLENERDFFQIDLPISRELRDYNIAMYRAIECISKSIGKSIEQIVLELLNPLSDIIRLRIAEPSIETGSIYIEDAIKLYDNAKKLITATAMDIINPQLLHMGRPGNNILEFVNNCRFGQTEIGSYVVSVVCPISKIDNNNYLQLSLFDEKEECANSLTRNVVNKVIKSVQIIKKAIDEGNFETAIYANANTNDCISANFLDALSEINIYREKSSLDIAVKYAPTIIDNKVENTIAEINHDYYSPIDTLVRKIKNNQEIEKTYIGRIKSLSAIPDAERRDKGSISIVFIDDNEKKATASVSLSKDDYDTAIEAHQNGKTVKVVGTLSGQVQKRIECNYFEVLE